MPTPGAPASAPPVMGHTMSLVKSSTSFGELPIMGMPASAQAWVPSAPKRYRPTTAMTSWSMVSWAQWRAASGSSLPPAPASQRTTSRGRAGPPAASAIPPAVLIAATAASVASKISGWATTPATAVAATNLIGSPGSSGTVGGSDPSDASDPPLPLSSLQPTAAPNKRATTNNHRYLRPSPTLPPGENYDYRGESIISRSGMEDCRIPEA